MENNAAERIDTCAVGTQFQSCFCDALFYSIRSSGDHFRLAAPRQRHSQNSIAQSALPPTSPSSRPRPIRPVILPSPAFIKPHRYTLPLLSAQLNTLTPSRLRVSLMATPLEYDPPTEMNSEMKKRSTWKARNARLRVVDRSGHVRHRANHMRHWSVLRRERGVRVGQVVAGSHRSEAEIYSLGQVDC